MQAGDPRLTDFAYPGDDKPAGVIERGMSEQVIGTIQAVAETVRASLDALPGHRNDCRYAVADWSRALRALGLNVGSIGGEGIDGDEFVGYALVPPDRRSGYRTPEGVRRHYWIEVGPERLVFDPTAHQFDDQGGVRLDRYLIGGQPFIAVRAGSQGA